MPTTYDKHYLCHGCWNKEKDLKDRQTIPCGVCKQTILGLDQHKVLADSTMEAFNEALDAVATAELLFPGSEYAAQLRTEFEKIQDSIPAQIEEMKQAARRSWHLQHERHEYPQQDVDDSLQQQTTAGRLPER